MKAERFEHSVGVRVTLRGGGRRMVSEGSLGWEGSGTGGGRSPNPRPITPEYQRGPVIDCVIPRPGIAMPQPGLQPAHAQPEPPLACGLLRPVPGRDSLGVLPLVLGDDVVRPQKDLAGAHPELFE